MTVDPPRVIREPISIGEVKEIAQRRFGDMAKACVDLHRRVMAIGGELHSDEEAVLLQDGSRQADVWESISTPTKRTTRGSSSIR